MSRLESDQRIALFPARSLPQALSEHQKAFPNFSKSLSTCRPSRVDGLAKTRNLFSNCNVLNARNTDNL